MSMSIDYGKLDRVYAFADFLDILANPEAMQRTVAEYKEQAEALKELIEAKTAVTEVDSYVARQKREVEDLVAFHTEEVRKSNEAVREQMQKLAAQQAAAAAKFQEAEVTRAEAMKAEDAAKQLLADAQKDREAAAAEFKAMSAERKALEAERKALADKEAKLRSLVS